MEPESRGPAPDGPARDWPNRESRRGGSSLPVGGEYPHAFRVETKTADLLMIEPSPAESSLLLYGSMNIAERVHSLERLAADRFLQQAAVSPRRRRFGMVRQESTAPDRGVFR